jgi:inosose dehydratase
LAVVPPISIERVAINPISWYRTAAGGLLNDNDAPALREVYTQVRRAGYTAVHAQVPSDMSLTSYRDLLEEVGLTPAPGYFQARFSDDRLLPQIAADARRIATEHAELGLDRIFIADWFAAPGRFAAPARGAGHDPARLERITKNLAHACAAMVEEGVTPCLHQHVGTWIETPDETVSVLDAVAPELLLFGPDTGHLAWAGADVPELVRRYANRVGAVHLKDVHRAICERALDESLSYDDATALHLWTEPGRGDVDLSAVVGALDDFDGWYLTEVDIADEATPELSAAAGVAWIRAYNEHVEQVEPLAP